jgi:hypothetical protein
MDSSRTSRHVREVPNPEVAAQSKSRSREAVSALSILVVRAANAANVKNVLVSNETSYI